jgi:hypothetical protein
MIGSRTRADVSNCLQQLFGSRCDSIAREVKFPPEEIDTRTIGKPPRILVCWCSTRISIPSATARSESCGSRARAHALGYYGLPELTAEFLRSVTQPTPCSHAALEISCAGTPMERSSW